MSGYHSPPHAWSVRTHPAPPLFAFPRYGTIIYFFSFALNRRYEGKPAGQVMLVVISNSIWIVFPLIGLYASYVLLDENDYSLFRDLIR